MAEITLEEPIVRKEEIEIAARFTAASDSHRLWYRVERNRQEELAVNADPFVLAFLHLAIGTGEDVFIRGAVSPSLLRNMEDFQRVWAAWEPKSYRPVSIRAENEMEPDLPLRRDAISGFSGGVDSCFTAFRHTKAVTTDFPFSLKGSVMVHGFDIPLRDPDGYQRATEKAQRQLEGLGVELYRVATNFTELPVDWVHAFGAGLASVLSLFQRRYSTGLMAQGIPYDSYWSLVNGSNPLSDPLLSSRSFTVVPDGAGFQRKDKIAALADWPEGLRDLRVCWRNEIHDENCCICEKCIRNILTFRALGIDLPPSFPLDVSDRQIRNLVPLSEQKIFIGFGPIVQLAESRGMQDESWVRVLRDAIIASRRYRLKRRVLRRLGLWDATRRLGLMR